MTDYRERARKLLELTDTRTRWVERMEDVMSEFEAVAKEAIEQGLGVGCQVPGEKNPHFKPGDRIAPGHGRDNACTLKSLYRRDKDGLELWYVQEQKDYLLFFPDDRIIEDKPLTSTTASHPGPYTSIEGVEVKPPWKPGQMFIRGSGIHKLDRHEITNEHFAIWRAFHWRGGAWTESLRTHFPLIEIQRGTYVPYPRVGDWVSSAGHIFQVAGKQFEGGVESVSEAIWSGSTGTRFYLASTLEPAESPERSRGAHAPCGQASPPVGQPLQYPNLEAVTAKLGEHPNKAMPTLEGPERCGAYVCHLIAGASWYPCALSKGHKGEHRASGNCFAHGEYLGEPSVPPQCPKCDYSQVVIEHPKPVTLAPVGTGLEGPWWDDIVAGTMLTFKGQQLNKALLQLRKWVEDHEKHLLRILDRQYHDFELIEELEKRIKDLEGKP